MATQRFYPRQKDYIKELNYLAGLVDLAQGDKGWSPQIVTVIDGARVVLQIADWVGGTGTKPAAGQFLGDGELVTDIEDAVDVRGPQGEQGIQGIQGEQGPQGIQGVQGEKGDTGDAGPANTLSIGTVTSGVSADATITGTAPTQTLNLVLPQGPKGDPGTDGSDGAAATITVGTVTTGAPGSSATVANSGTATAAVFDFTIPKGDKGDQGDEGDKGDSGDAATITVGTVTTGAPGSSATVTNVGTPSAAVLDITIPRGDPGAGSGDVASINGVMPDGGGNVELDPSDIGAVEEAPSNGKDHARKDGAWVEIEPGVSSWNDLTDKPAFIGAGATAADARSAIGAGTSNFDGDYNNLSNKPTIPAAQQQTDWDAVSGVTSIANKPAIIAAGATQAAARTAIGAAGVSASNTFSETQTINSSLNVSGNVILNSNSARIQSEATSGGAFFNISAGSLGTASGVGCDLNLSSGDINNPSNTTGNGGEVSIRSGTNFFTPDKEGSIILQHGYKTPVLELPNDLSFVVNGQAGTAGQVLTSAGAGNPVAWANAPATDWSNILNKPAIIAAGATQAAARTAIGAASATDLAGKQDTLVSGTNIKTINGESVLGGGNLSVSGVPTGSVIFHAANSAPTGFLKANGAAVSRSTYSALFTAIGTTFGTGDGATTFNVPDLRGRFARAWDDGAGRDTGRVFGSVQTDDNKGHTHTGTTSSNGAHTHTTTFGRTTNAASAVGTRGGTDNITPATSSSGAHTHTFTTDSSGTESRPINIALLACIKY